jgi:predicted MPP superfamily phosphohydrolase
MATALLLATVILGYAFLEARRDPVVRRTSIALADWPAGAHPIRLVLMSDIHIGSPAMDAARLTRLVGQVNALQPDLVLLAGDFIAGRVPHSAAWLAPRLVAPLAGLKAPLGVVAVPGNHDHWTGLDDVRQALTRAHVTVLANQAQARGPIAIAGVDDNYTHHDNAPATFSALAQIAGARVVLTHSPDLVRKLPGAPILLLAGHTHCGQVVLPILGPVSNVSHYGMRYLCGIMKDGARTVIVTGGVGTSGVPFRLGAPPDIWLITLGPPPGGAPPH